MNRIFWSFLALVSIVSCGNKIQFKSHNFDKVGIETLITDSSLNVRAIEIVKDTDALFFATSNGNFGFINGESVLYPVTVSDSLKLNFRAIATTKNNGFGVTIESPARIFKMKNDEITLVYQENHPKAFYDSLEFWNNQEGIAIGDPTDGCMSIIITRDGGNTWHKISCDKLPKSKEGEAAFAASDTNIAIVGNHTWVATGGKASRILYSPDKGEAWQIFETPIVQGVETTGMYSVDFYDDLNGFAIGGDYTKPDDNTANKIKTIDGGKTWKLVAQNQDPGYRSCVQYIPNSQAKGLIAIGFKGIDYSYDAGNTWKHLSDEGFYTIRFVNDSVAYAAGAGRISKLTFR